MLGLCLFICSKDTSKKTKKRQQHIFKTKKREVNRKVSMKLDSTRLKFERFKKDLRAKRDLRTSFNVKKANACFGKKRSATPLGYRTANKIDFRESASSFTRTKRYLPSANPIGKIWDLMIFSKKPRPP